MFILYISILLGNQKTSEFCLVSQVHPHYSLFPEFKCVSGRGIFTLAGLGSLDPELNSMAGAEVISTQMWGRALLTGAEAVPTQMWVEC